MADQFVNSNAFDKLSVFEKMQTYQETIEKIGGESPVTDWLERARVMFNAHSQESIDKITAHEQMVGEMNRTFRQAVYELGAQGKLSSGEAVALTGLKEGAVTSNIAAAKELIKQEVAKDKVRLLRQELLERYGKGPEFDQFFNQALEKLSKKTGISITHLNRKGSAIAPHELISALISKMGAGLGAVKTTGAGILATLGSLLGIAAVAQMMSRRTSREQRSTGAQKDKPDPRGHTKKPASPPESDANPWKAIWTSIRVLLAVLLGLLAYHLTVIHCQYKGSVQYGGGRSWEWGSCECRYRDNVPFSKAYLRIMEEQICPTTSLWVE